MISAPPQIPSFAQGYARAGESRYLELWRGLVRAWASTLGPTGLTLYDQSHYHNNGVLTNMNAGSDWVMTEKGWALHFDGVNEYVQTPQKIPIGAKSIAFWARPTESVHANANDTVYGETNLSSNAYGNSFSWNKTNSHFRWLLYRNVVSSYAVNLMTSALTPSNWYHVIFTWDGTTAANAAKSYVNGIADNTTTAGFAESQVPTNNGRIGKDYYSEDRTFEGDIASFAVWNRVLLPNEIMQLYIDPAALFRYPHHYRCLDGLPAVSDRAGRGVLTGGRM